MRDIAISRRAFTSAALFAAAGVAVPSVWSQPKLEKTRVSIAVDGKASFYCLPLIRSGIWTLALLVNIGILFIGYR